MPVLPWAVCTALRYPENLPGSIPGLHVIAKMLPNSVINFVNSDQQRPLPES